MRKKYANFFFLTFILFIMLNIITKPSICITGATEGLLLWFNKLLPSLLPFIILTNMLFYLNILQNTGALLDPFTKRLLGIKGASFIVFIMGLIAGYPTGAKLSKQLLDAGTLSFEEAEKTFFFANNCGALFIIGTVGTLLLGSPKIGYFLVLIHILSALTTLLLLNLYTPTSSTIQTCTTSTPPTTLSFASVFATSVQNGMDTIVYVGGYVIFFSVLISITKSSNLLLGLIDSLATLLNISPAFLQNIFLGSLEFSNGIFMTSTYTPFTLNHLALISAFISFGGFCVLFQSSHLLQGTSFSLPLYTLIKTIQAIIAYCYTIFLYPALFNDHTSPSFTIFIVLASILLIASIFLKLLSNKSPKAMIIKKRG